MVITSRMPVRMTATADARPNCIEPPPKAYCHISCISDSDAPSGPPLVRTMGSYMIWNTEMICRISSVPISLRIAGRVMWKIRCRTVAPSIAAAS